MTKGAFDIPYRSDQSTAGFRREYKKVYGIPFLADDWAIRALADYFKKNGLPSTGKSNAFLALAHDRINDPYYNWMIVRD